LPLAIKALVDTDPRKGQFILTGSSNMFASRHVADSLAGRLRTLTLWPLTAAEIHRAPPSRLIDWALGDAPDPGLLRVPVATRQDVIRLLLEGGFPEIRTLSLRTRQRQYRDNLDLMIDRDVADVMPIRKPDALRRLVDQLAARTANEVSVADLSKALSVRRETVDLYIDVLVRLSVVVRLGAWAAGASNREIKAPKFHLVDSGLLCALRGFRENTFDADADPAALGAVLESYVFNELVRAAPLQDEPAHLFHWRHADGREIDILIEAGRHLIAIEVEASSLINRDSFRHLRWFAREGPGRDRPVTGIVFHLGKEALSFGDRMFALPVAALWSSLNPQFRRNSASTLRSSAGPIQS
jgi:predicted AAA+ superfamily ATPase